MIMMIVYTVTKDLSPWCCWLMLVVSITSAKGTRFVGPFVRGVWSASLMLGVWKSHLAKQNLKGTCSTCIRLHEVKRRLGELLNTDINKNDLHIPNPMTKLVCSCKSSQPPQVFWTRRSQTLPGGNSVGRPSRTDNCSRVKWQSDMNKFGCSGCLLL